MKPRFVCLTAGCLLLAGCVMGPKYNRPAVDLPDQFRGAQASTAASLADGKWAEFFEDDVLKQHVTAAIEHNFDLGMASERVLAARALLTIEKAGEYPSVSGQGSFWATRPSVIGSSVVTPGSTLDVSYTQAGVAPSWELDLWGRLRRLTEAARARYLASEEARHGLIVSLVGDVTGTYLTLRERDLELEIACRTRDTARDSLRLVELRHRRGAASALDARQAEQLLYLAAAQIASAQRDIAQTENAISLLLGQAPGAIARGKPLDQFALLAEVPAGLPSALLERRPDIREAEQRLVAANAQIGAAKAMFFPQISLSGFLGGQSRALTSLLSGPARLWTISPGAVLPIFTAGQTRASVQFSEAQKREMLIAYHKAIYSALREVSDALVGYDRTREQRTQQQSLVNALSESTRLSTLRYKGGLESYLQVLDAQRNLFRGQLVLAQLRLEELLSFVQLYRALGGGWQ